MSKSVLPPGSQALLCAFSQPWTKGEELARDVTAHDWGRAAAQALGEEVAASVLELMTPTAGDGAWHGACLALAELARRGLLAPARLLPAAPLVARALRYDARRGSHRCLLTP